MPLLYHIDYLLSSGFTIADLDEQDWRGWDDFWELDTPLVLHFKDGSSQELVLFDNGNNNENLGVFI